MTKTRKAFYATSCALLLCVGYWIARKRTTRAVQQIRSTILAPNVEEKLIVSQEQHKITVIKRNKTGGNSTSTTYLPSHSAIEISRDGSVKVSAPQWGTELVPTFGFGYSDKARLVLGANVLYVKRFDVMPFLGIGVSGKVDGRLGMAISYNAYSNTHLFCGLQSNGGIVGGVSFNF